MKVVFKDKKLWRLYDLGSDSFYDKKYSKDIIKSFRKKIAMLEELTVRQEIYSYKSLHFELLHNYAWWDYSIRLNNQYRLILNILNKWDIEIFEIIQITDYH